MKITILLLFISFGLMSQNSIIITGSPGPNGAGGGTDNQTITAFSLSGNTLTISIEDGNTQTVDLSSLNNLLSSVSCSGDDLVIIYGGNTYTATNACKQASAGTGDGVVTGYTGNPGENIRTLLRSNGLGSISLNIEDADASITNELQTLSISGNTLTLSNANSVTLPSSTGGSGNWALGSGILSPVDNTAIVQIPVVGSIRVLGQFLDSNGSTGNSSKFLKGSAGGQPVWGDEVDGSVSNEGAISVNDGSGSTASLLSNTSGSNSVLFSGLSGLQIDGIGSNEIRFQPPKMGVAYATSDNSVATGANYVQVSFLAHDVGHRSYLSSNANGIVVNASGYVQVTFSATLTTSEGNYSQIVISRNGSAISTSNFVQNNAGGPSQLITTASTNAAFSVNAGDVIGALVRGPSGFMNNANLSIVYMQ